MAKTPRPHQWEGFDAFWALYPKKLAKSDAMKAWLQMTPKMEAVMPALEAQLASRLEAIRRGMWVPEWPYPATWLRGKRWEDVLEFTPMPRPAVVFNEPRSRREDECRISFGQEMAGESKPYEHEPAGESGYCPRCEKHAMRKP